jgi:hypothetical protein
LIKLRWSAVPSSDVEDYCHCMVLRVGLKVLLPTPANMKS